jgi:hypothetical protein
MTFLHIDSRHRRRTTSPHNAIFDLSRPMQRIKTARLKSLVFVNSIDNISEGWNDTLLTSGGPVVLAPYFYTATELVEVLNANLSLTASYGAGTWVSLDPNNNRLNWTLGTNTISGYSSMGELLGLPNANAALTGSFTTTLHLARPLYVSWSCNELRGGAGNIHAGHTDPKDSLQPLCVIPVTSGYLEQQVYEPTVERALVLDSSRNGATLSSLNFRVVDPANGRDLTELASWGAVFELN